MRKAVLLFNERSGGRRNHRENDLRSALQHLCDAGVACSLVRTQSSADAAEQARIAVGEGCDTVFACGGDGTVHDVLQGMVGSQAALGVVPLGTANALAHDLGIPLDPARAVRAVLSGEPRRIAVGKVQARGMDGAAVSRHFTVAVGIGVDAHLFYKLNAATKQKLGMHAYYAKAWHLWFTHRMERFRVQWNNGESPAAREGVTELLAVRIRNFGGVLQELAPGASLDRNDLRLVVCRTSSRASYLMYVVRGLLGHRWSVPGVELVHAESATCSYSLGAEAPVPAGPKVYVEADGELIGTLPADISIVPDALTVLVPKS